MHLHVIQMPQKYAKFMIILVFQLELYIYITYMHQIYKYGFFKLKNMDWFSICAYLYMHFFVWFLFGTSYSDSICDILKQ
jgi:hypothetical protein